MSFNKETSWVVVVMVFAVILSFSTISLAQEIQTNEEENKIISIVLDQYKGKNINLVSYKTWNLNGYLKKDSLEELKEKMKNKLKLPEDKASSITEAFFKLNKKPAIITLKTNRSKGYVIDRKYSNLKGGLFNWFFLVRQEGQEYEGAEASFIISRPYYHQETGTVLLYIGWVAGPLYAQGEIIQYQYRNGNLTKVDRVILWVS